jgi:hypothetical protein
MIQAGDRGAPFSLVAPSSPCGDTGMVSDYIFVIKE